MLYTFHTCNLIFYSPPTPSFVPPSSSIPSPPYSLICPLFTSLPHLSPLKKPYLSIPFTNPPSSIPYTQAYLLHPLSPGLPPPALLTHTHPMYPKIHTPSYIPPTPYPLIHPHDNYKLPNGTLTTALLMPLGGENICNHIRGQVLGSMNSYLVNSNVHILHF